MIRVADGPARSSVEETRQRILSATRELYARNGSRGTTTREVADLAGVNEATLFRHFGTKQQLIAAMLDQFCGSTSYPEVIENARRLPTIDAQLRALGRSAIENISRKEDLLKIGMAEEVTNPDGSTFAFRGPVEARRALTGFFREKVEARELQGEPESLARVFMSFFFAFVMARKLWNEARDAESVVATCVDIFLNGARVR